MTDWKKEFEKVYNAEIVLARLKKAKKISRKDYWIIKGRISYLRDMVRKNLKV